MATTKPTQETFEEVCESCGRATPHYVSLRLVTESKKQQNAEFSREPYRVTECTVCGEERQQRMNNA
ncbi:MAG: hypothetical protein ABEJ28_00925 [Salinigranum sp.]